MSKKLSDIFKELEEEPKEIKEIDLHKPPKTSKPVKKDHQKKTGDVEFKIDWIKVANSSDFKRAVFLALEGKVWRGKDADLEKELNKKIEVFRDPDFSNLVKELKENFKNGFVKPSQMNKQKEKIKNGTD